MGVRVQVSESRMCKNIIKLHCIWNVIRESILAANTTVHSNAIMIPDSSVIAYLIGDVYNMLSL